MKIFDKDLKNFGERKLKSAKVGILIISVYVLMSLFLGGYYYGL